MDFEKENSVLKEKIEGEWWKPTEGMHKVTFLENLKEPTKRTIRQPDGKEKEVEQSDVLIEVDKKRYKWSITKAITKKSLWGQLMYFGKNVKDLTGQTCTIIVKGQGKQRDYTIFEVVQLKQQQGIK